jgi:protein-S-isoprenylcysteine O-methyltransferase Ste14
MVYWIAWGIFTTLLLGFTLIRTHPYRFSRFLAFEGILSLIFLNARLWFVDPFSPRQILSWILLFGSTVLVIQGFYLIKSRGAPRGDFEDTTQLITNGIYRYIRHPLYASLLLLGAGVYFKQPTWIGTVLLGLTLLGIFLTANIEEQHNLERFGEEYREYMEKTNRFIPFIY